MNFFDMPVPAHTKPNTQDDWLSLVQAAAEQEPDLVTISSSSSDSESDPEVTLTNTPVNVDQSFKSKLHELFGEVSP